MKLDSFLDIYNAGEVRRYHTMRTLHDQSIAEHSWGVGIIILWLYEDVLPSAELIRAALLHDVPETKTGDHPANIKWESPGLDKILTRLEDDFCREHELPITDTSLSSEDNYVLRFADYAELTAFCITECTMGNGRMHLIAERGLAKMEQLLAAPPIRAIPRAQILTKRMEEMWKQL